MWTVRLTSDTNHNSEFNLIVSQDGLLTLTMTNVITAIPNGGWTSKGEGNCKQRHRFVYNSSQHTSVTMWHVRPQNVWRPNHFLQLRYINNKRMAGM